MRIIKHVCKFTLLFILANLSQAQAQSVSDNERNSPSVENRNETKSNEIVLNNKTINAFINIYQDELTPTEICPNNQSYRVQICSSILRNEGNGPYILIPKEKPKGTVVLFHGLSDSPFFMSSMAETLQSIGYLVIAPLTPGHGKKEADLDMQDEFLLNRWYQHIEKVMEFADTFGFPVTVGGFSTGGAFATHYALYHPKKVNSLLLFSGALQLTRSAEAMSNIWGMKSLAKLLDGKYETSGPHPYKYPSVASYSGLVLMDLIKDIRTKLEENEAPNFPIFAAHSMADRVTLFNGIENLTSHINGSHTIFKIDESYDLCHADLPISNVQLVSLDFDKSQVNVNERCAVPKANPLHAQMMLMLKAFMQEHN